MKRKHNSYARPKRPFEKIRIEEEAEIKKKFGLKNKKEIWKAEAKINTIRSKAKRLISSSNEEKEKFFEGLRKMGIKVNSLADVLSLEKEDYLDRRLQTLVFKKRLTTTPRSARQLITHKKILVDGRVINIPSYIVPIELENKISVNRKIVKRKNKTEGKIENA